ncbi:2-octaprenyl-3-methyl-6-methoxy-1,4-benzoquinol hydroxylase [alpha proteobacterium U9-1i]|nr:2-octaprenyl-3-methyl-6-methoxy-1,4-benzoquinol hydroxylase [alpha proteobacterium U9-1i]
MSAKEAQMSDYDLIIVGAGPAGLSLAARLAGAPLRIALIDKSSEAALSEPAYDGREIALTRASIERLRTLGAWQRLGAKEAAPLVRAEVLDGASSFVLPFTDRRAREPLGALVSNAALRRALFECVQVQGDCDLFAGRTAHIGDIDDKGASLRLQNESTLAGKLIVAADTRFSSLRQCQGIGAHIVDFGRTMLVCRVRHTQAHNNVATEWFDRGQTIAMLPLLEGQSSFVLTLDTLDMAGIKALSAEAFAREIERRTQRRWGEITLTSERFYYPLIAVYADRFVAPRFALLGDAAVGMHPVTAHGFNFGLKGAFALGREILATHREGRDIGASRGLARYERDHRRATLPLFAATNAIAKLYADERMVARWARGAGLRLMNAAPGARRIVEASLSGAHA